MCGISGYISEKKLISKNNIHSTLSLMKRRGPDSKGHFIKNYISKEVALLHTRLNIIDLNNRSNQPFLEDNFVLVFNGEIYNYIELRDRLKKKYNFYTESDTEVLMKCYKEYGENCVDHFIGMWSFAIWDLENKKLFLSRDPFGEKPLFFFFNDNGFFFGSEIKFIKSLSNINFKKNKKLLHDNLLLGYKSTHKTNETYYDNIYSLENSHNLSVDLNLNLKNYEYWKPEINIKEKMTLDEASEGTKHNLFNSLKLRMRADVPIAFCLSGGVDSSLLASIAKKKLNKNISTFSILDKDERYNEKNNIDKTTEDLKINSNLINLENNKDIFLDRVKTLTNYHDGPISTLSYYIQSFLSEKISNKKFKVSISGTGADELFTGYYDHYLLHLQTLNKTNYFNKNLEDWNKFVKPKIRNIFLKDPMIYIKNPKNRDIVYEKNFDLLKYSRIKKLNNFTEKYYCDELLRNRMMNELFHEVVPVILKHDDLNCMYYSLENRSPYLDRNLLDFALTIPPQFLIQNGFQKNVLRESAKGILNEQVRCDRQKKGFNASINSVVNLENDKIQKFIFDKNSEVSELINLDLLKKDIDRKSIPNHFSKLIFSIITTKIFMD